ncbi:MAG: KTSC domain-containing protein [Hyphomonadaceae bacterium]|nr:KTSC domain-containing protein [Hyphomonadaceae bacterium]
MAPVSVSSSAISQVDYDPRTAVLRVWFTSGKVYDYFGVPAALFEGLVNAPSVGRFFNDHIRDQFSAA